MYACMQNLVQMVSVQKLPPEQLLPLISVMPLFFIVSYTILAYPTPKKLRSGCICWVSTDRFMYKQKWGYEKGTKISMQQCLSIHNE